MASSPIEQNLTGKTFKTSEAGFLDGLKTAVDYRGDVTISFVNGSSVEGYLFNHTVDRVDLFPKNSPRAISVSFKDIDTLTFSGEDTADGKSYDDWLTKKEAEKAAIRAQPIEMA